MCHVRSLAALSIPAKPLTHLTKSFTDHRFDRSDDNIKNEKKRWRYLTDLKKNVNIQTANENKIFSLFTFLLDVDGVIWHSNASIRKHTHTQSETLLDMPRDRLARKQYTQTICFHFQILRSYFE